MFNGARHAGEDITVWGKKVEADAMTEVFCLFCFRDFDVEKAPFRCTTENCPDEQDDATYYRFRPGIARVDMGKVLDPPQEPEQGVIARLFNLGQKTQVICKGCGQTAKTRICPHCHFDLPHDTGQISQEIIALIGGSSTGKTCYIASLINTLNVSGANVGVSGRFVGDDTRRRWSKDFYTPIFVDHILPPPTGVSERAVKIPLIYRVTARGTHSMLNLTFFDAAGENMNSTRAMDRDVKQILRSRGIIFLLDPLQIPAVRARLEARGEPESSFPPERNEAQPEFIVASLLDLFEELGLIPVGGRIDLPIAFVLSKVDRLTPLLARGSTLYSSSRSGSHSMFDPAEIESVNAEIATYIQDWSPSLYALIRDHFSHFTYLGVSALGSNPVGGKIISFNPHRVEDPFLWMLTKLHVI